MTGPDPTAGLGTGRVRDFDDDLRTFGELSLAQQRQRLITEVLGIDPETAVNVVIHVEGDRAWAEWDGRRQVTSDELTEIATILRAER